MAHLLAKLIYRGLTRGQAYMEAGLAVLESQNNNNNITALHRRAHRLGYELTSLQKTAGNGAFQTGFLAGPSRASAHCVAVMLPPAAHATV